MPTIWDYTPLGTAVSPEEVAAFRKEARTREGFATAGTGLTAVVFVIVAIIAVVFGGLVLSSVIRGFSAGGSPGAAPVVIIVVVVLGAICVGFLVRRSLSAQWANLLRQSRFADANGLLFSRRDANPTYPGAIFGIGSSRAALDHFRAASGRYLDFGNYRYTTGSGKNQSTHNWGFLALRLDRALPHMVLDSRSNNGLFGGTTLPVAFDRDQTLSLEGDFDRYFTLYCPREYESDALYVLTPDLMALLIDGASGFDVEIIDDWMFVYSTTRFDMTDPSVIERLRRIVETVGEKTLSQTERYADDRASVPGGVAASGSPLTSRMQSNIVAPAGRRLKKRYPVVALLVVAAIVVFQLVRVFFGG